MYFILKITQQSEDYSHSVREETGPKEVRDFTKTTSLVSSEERDPTQPKGEHSRGRAYHLNFNWEQTYQSKDYFTLQSRHSPILAPFLHYWAVTRNLLPVLLSSVPGLINYSPLYVYMFNRLAHSLLKGRRKISKISTLKTKCKHINLVTSSETQFLYLSVYYT